MRDTFVLHTAYAEKFKRLTDEQFGKLIRLLMLYQSTGETQEINDPLVACAFDVVKVELDIGNKKYAEVCEKRRIAGSMGGAPKGNQNASKTSKNNHNDNDNGISISDFNNTNHLKEEDIEIIERENPKENIISLSEKRFNEFWGLYPRKEGKGAARKSWEKINPNAELFDRILNAVRDNIDRNPQWKRDNGQFIPHPATWLNQGRWDDDISSLKHTQSIADRWADVH